MPSALEQLLEYCRASQRICPQPQQWNKLFQMLPNVKRVGAGSEPSAPLILAAWWHSTDADKQQRFESHIRWAYERGAIDQVDKFLRALPESEWHHVGA